MANNKKIRQLIEKLGQFEQTLPMDDEMRSLADDILNKEFNSISKQVKSSSVVKYLDKLNTKLVELKKAIDITPLEESISQLEDDILSLKDAIATDLEAVGVTFTEKHNELTSLLENTRNDLEGLTNSEVKKILEKVVSLEDSLTYQAEESNVSGQTLKGAIKSLEERLNVINKGLSDVSTKSEAASVAFNTRLEDSSSTIQGINESISKLRQEFNNRIANIGGGNANRNIAINGNGSVLSKYTDINLIASSNIGLIPVANNTTKQTDVYITGSAGGGSGTVTSVLAGTGIVVDDSTPSTPIVILGNTSVTAASYGNATTVPAFTVDAQGRLSAASNIGITFPTDRVSSVVSGTGIAVDNTNPIAPVVALGNTSVTTGTYGSDITVPQITIDQQGRITSASTVGITFPASGGANPAGSDTEVQFRLNASTFGASSTLSWDYQTSVLTIDKVSIDPSIRTSVAGLVFRSYTPADTLLSNVETISTQIGGSSNLGTVARQFIGGGSTMALQRENIIVHPTYNSSVTQTITQAATLAVTGAPVAGVNTSIASRVAILSNVATNQDQALRLVSTAANATGHYLMEAYSNTSTLRFGVGVDPFSTTYGTFRGDVWRGTGAASNQGHIFAASYANWGAGQVNWGPGTSEIGWGASANGGYFRVSPYGAFQFNSTGYGALNTPDTALIRASVATIRISNASSGAGKLVIGNSSVLTNVADVYITGSDAGLSPLRVDSASSPTAKIASFREGSTETLAITKDSFAQWYSVGASEKFIEAFEGATDATQSRFYIQRGDIGAYETTLKLTNTFGRQVGFYASNNYFVFDGTSTNPTALYYRTAAGASIYNIFNIQVNFASSPSAGFGVSQGWYAKTLSADREIMNVAAAWTDVTDATRTGYAAIYATNQATSTQKFATGVYKTVATNNAALGLFEIALPTLKGCSGTLHYQVFATDGTDVQVRSGIYTFSAVNKAGSYTTASFITTENVAASTGTLTASFAVTSGTNKVTIEITPNTSLTTTSYYVTYTLDTPTLQAVTIL